MEKTLNDTYYFFDLESNEFEISGQIPKQDDVYEFAMEFGIVIDEKIFDLLYELLKTYNFEQAKDKIAEFFKKRYEKNIELNYSEEYQNFKLTKNKLEIPILSKNSGNLGQITITGEFTLNEVLGLLAFYDSFVSVIEGFILGQRLELLLRSALNTLFIALNKRTRLSEKELSTMEKIAVELAKYENINQEFCLIALRTANVGLIGVRDELFEKIKLGIYNSDEWSEYLCHVDHGYEILKEIEVQKELIDICLYHHEVIDGTGPKKLNPNEIPPLALIIGISESIVLLKWTEELLKNKYPENYVNIALNILRLEE